MGRRVDGMHEHVTSTAFSRRGLHGQLVDALGSRIVGGRILPGETIDGQAVEEEFGVSRTVVREALKVLTAKGLVDARPRLGTYVRARVHWNLLDGDIMAWRGSTENPDHRLLLELGEVRAIVEPGAAGLAASRRTVEQLERIRSALKGMENAPDVDATIDADIDFHLSVLAGAGNELMERFEVMLVPALRARDTVTLRQSHGTEYLVYHREVFEAIERSDAEAAERSMRQLLTTAADDAAKVLRRD